MGLLAAGHTNSPYLTLIDTATKLTIACPPIAGQVNGVAFSPDGVYLAAAHATTPYLTVINTSTGAKVSGIAVLPNAGTSVAFSPNGASLAVGYNGGLRVLNTADWSINASAPSTTGVVSGVAFSPDGATLAFSRQSTPGLLAYRTSDWGQVLSAFSNGYAVAFSPDGAYLAGGYGAPPYVAVYATSTWTAVNGSPALPGPGYSAAFSPSGATLAMGASTSPYWRLINVPAWTTVAGTPPMGWTVFGVAYLGDASLIALAQHVSPYLTVLNISTWSDASYPSLAGSGKCVAFSPITLPYRNGIIYNYAGAPVSTEVHLLTRPLMARSQIVTSNAAGEFRLIGWGHGDYLAWGINPGGVRDVIRTVTLDANSGALPPLKLYLPYVGTTTAVSGNATKATGGPADEVVMHARYSYETIAVATPASNGDWTIQSPPGQFFLTYRADGCAPICHGPYETV